MALLTWLPAPALAQGPVSIDALPPVVVATTPRSGDGVVRPSLKEIRVTFSKNMNIQNSWSWVMVDKASFPKIIGPVSYLHDGRTCMAPVQLEPEHDYAIWFNSSQHQGFRDASGKPAVPYLLVFRTAK